MLVLGMDECGHKWEKKNLVTLSSRKGLYDLYVCANCALEGKSYTPGCIEIQERYSKKAECCQGLNRKKYLRVTNCRAFGEQFRAFTPGSIHEVIPAPKGEDNSRGEWVMGKTEPVLLLFREFEYVEQ